MGRLRVRRDKRVGRKGISGEVDLGGGRGEGRQRAE